MCYIPSSFATVATLMQMLISPLLFFCNNCWPGLPDWPSLPMTSCPSLPRTPQWIFIAFKIKSNTRSWVCYIRSVPPDSSPAGFRDTQTHIWFLKCTEILSLPASHCAVCAPCRWSFFCQEHSSSVTFSWLIPPFLRASTDSSISQRDCLQPND